MRIVFSSFSAKLPEASSSIFKIFVALGAVIDGCSYKYNAFSNAICALPTNGFSSLFKESGSASNATSSAPSLSPFSKSSLDFSAKRPA